MPGPITTSPALGSALLESLEATPFPSFIIDANGIIQWSNLAFTHLCGAFALSQNPEGKPLVIHGEKSNNRAIRRLYEILQAHRSFVFNLLNYNYSHGYYWLKLMGEPIKNPLPHLQDENLFLVFAEDISNQKKKENNLHRLRTALESIRDAVVITSAETRTNAPIDVGIVYVNRAFSEITGYSKEEVIGKTPSILLGPNTSQSELERIDEAILNKESIEVECINYRKDGTEFWANIVITPIFDEEGNLDNWVSIRRDITKRKEGELALKQAKEAAEVASKAKNEFLSVISHELRTPLNGIIGSSELLIESPLTSDQKESIEMIRQSSERLLSIIKSILDYADLNEGLTKKAMGFFDLRDYMEKLMDMYAYAVKRKQLEYTFFLDPDLPKLIQSDINLLSKAFNQLVRNAIKFTQKGNIHLSFKMIKAQGMIAYFQFAVKDTGIGISPQHQKKLFQFFSQVDSTNSRVYEGLGLGLSMCLQIAKILGGDISVKSEEGEGSTFYFNFQGKLSAPFKPLSSEVLAVLASTENTSEEFPDLSDIRVLVAEDSKINQRLIKRLLDKVKASVVIVENGEEAIEHVVKNHVDLIFMDIQMPVMDGIEATTAIRGLEGIKQPYIVALTANASESNRHNCLEAGMDDFLTKPIKVPFFKVYMKHLLPILKKNLE